MQFSAFVGGGMVPNSPIMILKNQIEADKNYDFCNNSVPPAHGPSRLEAHGRRVDDTDFQS